MSPTGHPTSYEKGLRVGFDIGGTFTDIVAITSEGRVTAKKTLSVLVALVGELRSVIEELLGESERLEAFAHATTIASNALLEGTYGRGALITTQGFRDDIELRRTARPPIFDFGWERLPPLIPRRRRTEVVERIAADGAVVTPLDVDSVERAVSVLQVEEVDAIAVSLVNAHANPHHELQVVEFVRRAFPDIEICASHEVLPKSGEYERASTTSVNAVLASVVSSYLDRIEQELRPHSGGMDIMQSNGGLMTTAQARRFPVRMIESGPAAGALCAAALANELDLARVVSFDMGGTTVKACLVQDGRASEKYEYEVGGESNTANRLDRGTGYAVLVPSFDIVEAGSGGGSIAWDADGSLRVGPRSAGADPGPACYGHGGLEPTVTDANVALGYINPNAIAGDSLAIDHGLAIDAVATLGDKLGLDMISAADGIHQIANAAMMRTIRAVTTERGHDPRDYTFVAFGGSGPVHAAALAGALGVETVLVPPFPGVFSALGLVIADFRYDLLHNIGTGLDYADMGEVDRGFGLLREQALAEGARQGLDPSGIQFERYLDLSYVGQSTDLVVRFPDACAAERQVIAGLFHDEHDRMFKYRQENESIKFANLRLKAFTRTRSSRFRSIAEQFAADTRPWKPGKRRAYFTSTGTVDVRAVPRRALLSQPLVGPAIVEEPDTTVVVPPGWSASLNDLGCIAMTPDRSALE